jgi:hypothetical protein
MGKPTEKGPPPPDWLSTDLAMVGADDYMQLSVEYREIVVRQAADEIRRKDISKRLQEYHNAVGVKKAAVGGKLQVILGNGRTASKLDKGQLLLAGVEADVIKACTVAGTPYTYISVLPLEEEPVTYDNDQG